MYRMIFWTMVLLLAPSMVLAAPWQPPQLLSPNTGSSVDLFYDQTFRFQRTPGTNICRYIVARSIGAFNNDSDPCAVQGAQCVLNDTTGSQSFRVDEYSLAPGQYYWSVRCASTQTPGGGLWANARQVTVYYSPFDAPRITNMADGDELFAHQSNTVRVARHQNANRIRVRVGYAGAFLTGTQCRDCQWEGDAYASAVTIPPNTLTPGDYDLVVRQGSDWAGGHWRATPLRFKVKAANTPGRLTQLNYPDRAIGSYPATICVSDPDGIEVMTVSVGSNQNQRVYEDTSASKTSHCVTANIDPARFNLSDGEHTHGVWLRDGRGVTTRLTTRQIQWWANNTPPICTFHTPGAGRIYGPIKFDVSCTDDQGLEAMSLVFVANGTPLKLCDDATATPCSGTTARFTAQVDDPTQYGWQSGRTVGLHVRDELGGNRMVGQDTLGATLALDWASSSVNNVQPTHGVYQPGDPLEVTFDSMPAALNAQVGLLDVTGNITWLGQSISPAYVVVPSSMAIGDYTVVVQTGAQRFAATSPIYIVPPSSVGDVKCVGTRYAQPRAQTKSHLSIRRQNEGDVLSAGKVTTLSFDVFAATQATPYVRLCATQGHFKQSSLLWTTSRTFDIDYVAPTHVDKTTIVSWVYDGLGHLKRTTHQVLLDGMGSPTHVQDPLPQVEVQWPSQTIIRAYDAVRLEFGRFEDVDWRGDDASAQLQTKLFWRCDGGPRMLLLNHTGSMANRGISFGFRDEAQQCHLTLEVTDSSAQSVTMRSPNFAITSTTALTLVVRDHDGRVVPGKHVELWLGSTPIDDQLTDASGLARFDVPTSSRLLNIVIPDNFTCYPIHTWDAATTPRDHMLAIQQRDPNEGVCENPYTNGHKAFCAHQPNGCLHGQGDADEGQCAPGLVLGVDQGAKYGLGSTNIDVCVDPSTNPFALGDRQYCAHKPDRCGFLEGHCARFANQCQDGLICRRDVGAMVGLNGMSLCIPSTCRDRVWNGLEISNMADGYPCRPHQHIAQCTVHASGQVNVRWLTAPTHVPLIDVGTPLTNPANDPRQHDSLWQWTPAVSQDASFTIWQPTQIVPSARVARLTFNDGTVVLCDQDGIENGFDMEVVK